MKYIQLFAETQLQWKSKVISLNRLVPYPGYTERRIQVPDKEFNLQWQNVRPNVKKPENIPPALWWPLVATTKIAWCMIQETVPQSNSDMESGLLFSYLARCKAGVKGNLANDCSKKITFPSFQALTKESIFLWLVFAASFNTARNVSIFPQWLGDFIRDSWLIIH